MNAPDSPDPDDIQPGAPRPLDHTLVDAFLENIPDIVYFKDRLSRFVAVSRSKAARHGFSDPAQMVGMTDADLFSARYAQATRDDELEIMRTGRSAIGKVERITWPDGRESWVRSSKMPLRDRSGEIVGTFGMSVDITEARRMEEALEKARKESIDASRMAGMAEVATGVLHNVGNVLNSLNVSAAVIGSSVRQSKADSLAKVAEMLRANAADLGNFLSNDPKGRLVPEFLESFARRGVEERSKLLSEIDSLQRNIDHIKEIVAMQQAYATMVGVVEALDAAALMEDAVRMNAAALRRHEVAVVRDFRPAPPVLAERGKVLQILINLIRNSKYATDEARTEGKAITLRVDTGASGRVRFTVSDNGVGIPAENLTRIFQHGFTTKRTGHGFGLHSSALAAKEMHGTLAAESAGPGKGATFILELPAADSSAAAAA
jgi:PAS domain S-box-containing protein